VIDLDANGSGPGLDAVTEYDGGRAPVVSTPFAVRVSEVLAPDRRP
jgi:hypothetical protein